MYKSNINTVLLIFQRCMQIFGWNFTRLLSTSFIKYILNWQIYASFITTRPVLTFTAHTVSITAYRSYWLHANCPGIIEKIDDRKKFRFISAGLHVWAWVDTLERYQKHQPEPKLNTVDEFKGWQTTWKELSCNQQGDGKCLTACVATK